MEAETRASLEVYWEGLQDLEETKLKLTEIAGAGGLSLEQLAEKYGFSPHTLEPK